jgi:hypothetical protein
MKNTLPNHLKKVAKNATINSCAKHLRPYSKRMASKKLRQMNREIKFSQLRNANGA